MRVRALVQNLWRLIFPDDPPRRGRSENLINTDSPNDERTPSESSNTDEVPPKYSNPPLSTPPPSYSDLFPSPARTPSPTPASGPAQARPAQARTTQSKSLSHPRGSLFTATSISQPCAIEPPFEPECHKQSISVLFRLPDNLLRIVIQNLDNCGVECLRRVSRRFMPSCNEEILTRPHSFQPRWKLSDRGGPFPWPRFRIFDGSHAWTHLGAGERQRFLQLLSRDGYCEGCRRARKAFGWDRRVERLRRRLYCHSCKADHPACLFSVPQRQLLTSPRRCIAHEGFFRLCQHDEGIVRWADISQIRKQLKDDGKLEDHHIICCHDASHVVCCAQSGPARSGRRCYIPDCYQPTCVEWAMPELRVDASGLKLRWSAHMPIQTHGRPLTENHLRLQLANIRQKGGRFLYPATTSEQDVPEMRCFDSNECDCLSIEGPGNVESRPGKSLASDSICRTNFSRKLSQSLSNIYPRRLPSTASSIHEQLRAHSSDSSGPCESSRKEHAARWYFFAPAQVKVACWPCHSSDSCLVVNYTRMLAVGWDGAIDAQWYQALDPDSYNLTGDEEGYKVYWCLQNECRNYYGRAPGFSRIIGGAEYNRPV